MEEERGTEQEEGISDICTVDWAHTAESFPSERLEPCHLIKGWTRMARDSLDTVLGYAHHETKLLRKFWKYINANHSSFRGALEGTSCTTRHVLYVWISVPFPFPMLFSPHQHCSLFEGNTSGEFLKVFPKTQRSLYVFQGINQKLLINNNKKPAMFFVLLWTTKLSESTFCFLFVWKYLFKGKNSGWSPQSVSKGALHWSHCSTHVRCGNNGHGRRPVLVFSCVNHMIPIFQHAGRQLPFLISLMTQLWINEGEWGEYKTVPWHKTDVCVE